MVPIDTVKQWVYVGGRNLTTAHMPVDVCERAVGRAHCRQAAQLQNTDMKNQNSIKKSPPTRLAWRVAELAAASGLSIQFLRKEIREGKLPKRKLGGAVIVLDSDARAYLAGSTENSEAQNQAESLPAAA
jgi:hypothetical protein